MVVIIKDKPYQQNPTRKSGNRGYATAADRNRAIAQLRKHGANYFVKYVDVKSRYALSFSWAHWVSPGRIYIG